MRGCCLWYNGFTTDYRLWGNGQVVAKKVQVQDLWDLIDHGKMTRVNQDKRQTVKGWISW
jgi:hypothetical protein